MTDYTAGTFNTPVLIADKVSMTEGSPDSTPQITLDENGQPASVALEIRSKNGALLIPRLTTDAKNLLNSTDGMIFYDKDEEVFYMRSEGSFKVISGNSDINLPIVPNHVAIFSDTKGTIRDSGVPIAPRLPFLSASQMSPASDFQIGNLGYVQFAGTAGYVFLGEGNQAPAVIQMFAQPFPQNCCLLVSAGDIPVGGPSSASCAFEINTRHGAFLLSRMDQIDVDGLVNPQNGMLLYNADEGKVQARESGVWTNIQTGIEKVTTITSSYDALLSDNVIVSNVPTFSPVIKLPANPPQGLTYKIFDYSGAAEHYPINLDGNGKNVNGNATEPNNLSEVTVGPEPSSVAITNNNIICCTNRGVTNGGIGLSIYHNVTSLLADINHSSFRSPTRVVVTPDNNRAYVSNNGSNTVSVITNLSSSPDCQFTVAVQNAPGEMAITPNGGRLYVANYGSHSVSVLQNVQSSTPQVLQTLLAADGINQPLKVAITPNGQRVYILNFSPHPTHDNFLTCYENASTSPTFLGRYNIMASIHRSGSFVITPDGNHAYMSSYASSDGGSILFFKNISSGTPEVFWDQGSAQIRRPTAIAITPDGNYAYVVNNATNSVTVINNASSLSAAILKTIVVGPNPTSIAITPDGYYAYVTISNSGNGTSTAVIREASSDDCDYSHAIPCQTNPSAIAITQDGNYAYVANTGHTTMTVVRNASGYRAVGEDYGSAFLTYNGTGWNAVKSSPI